MSPMRAALLLLFGTCFVGAGLAPGAMSSGAAVGPCDPVQETLTVPRAELGELVNEWRMANLGQPPAAFSRPLDLAAQWFAEQAVQGRTSGHIDAYGRNWVARLQDCGYDPSWAGGSGEALATFFAQEGAGRTPTDALRRLTAPDPGHSNVVQAPVRWQCLGVGYARNEAATGTARAHVWVVVMAQYASATCPQPDSMPSPSPSPTVSPSPSPTPPSSLSWRTVVPGLAR